MSDEYPGPHDDPDHTEPPAREQPHPEPPPPPGHDQPPEEHDVESVLAGAGDFTSGEGLVAFSGMILLIVWVVFDVFFDSYAFNYLTILLATTVVILPRLDPDKVEKASHGPTAMKVGGYALAILGVITFVGDIEQTNLDSIGGVLAGLLSYGAYVMAFLGARQIET